MIAYLKKWIHEWFLGYRDDCTLMGYIKPGEKLEK